MRYMIPTPVIRPQKDYTAALSTDCVIGASNWPSRIPELTPAM